MLLAIVLVAGLRGCSKKASEDIPPEQAKSEAAKMDVEQLKAKVAQYEEAIKAKQPEIEKLQKEIGAGLADAMSGKKTQNADTIKKELEALQKSVQALTERMGIYAAELKKKAS
ncbi:MAG: hypothetical protein LLG01_13450 [Planctomycetaceae bacterium]|nr:hypothetical protein [Planctomycetaceae bacterium]